MDPVSIALMAFLSLLAEDISGRYTSPLVTFSDHNCLFSFVVLTILVHVKYLTVGFLRYDLHTMKSTLLKCTIQWA